MQKMKLGLSLGVFAALVYFSAMINLIWLVLLVGFVLIFEQNEWLKRCVLKALLIVVCFSLFNVVIGMGDDLFLILNAVLTWFNAPFQLYWPFHLNIIFLKMASLIEALIFILLGFKALKQQDVKLPFIDKWLSQYIL
ncbi:MAG: hypothetical protein ACRCST_15940 [Turicibacter sp.]